MACALPVVGALPGVGVGGERALRVVGLHPIDHQQPDVGGGVAKGADLPVEDGDDRAVIVGHAVVEPVVAVDDRGWSLLGDAGGQLVVDLADAGQVARSEERRVGKGCGSTFSYPWSLYH